MTRALLLGVLLLLAAGCSRAPSTAAKPGERPLVKVTLQTDFYAQAEHGGFYQALLKGFYREEGLDVKIIQGGPMAPVGLNLATGIVQFSIGRSDDAIISVSHDIPFVVIAAMMQNDPQALMVHRESPVRKFEDLNGRVVMTNPGAAWASYLMQTHHMKFYIMPMNYGMAQFMADPGFIQQCFATNEPFYVEQNGQHARVLMISDGGYDPYRVIVANADYAAKHPDVARAFARASIRGWEDYLHGDPSLANAEIGKLNLQMTPPFLAYAIQAMKDYKLVEGDPAKGQGMGLISRKRMQRLIDILDSLKMLDRKVTVDEVVTSDYLRP
jgi:NitT/TauT family transport system substrate-binding protein